MLDKSENSVKKYTYIIIASLLAVLAVRLIISAYLPYMDTTEARYGLIARIISEKNALKTWIMPEFNYEGMPFWAKPPLSFWLSAISFNILGVNEFAGRFPYFILSILTILIVGKWALKMGKFDLLFFAFVLVTMPVFLMHISIVSTDTAHNLAVALTMISFWKAINSEKKNKWGYLFFIGVGIGFMTRGPLVLAFVAPPLFIWLFIEKKWKYVRSRIPWILGISITALITIPWYITANIVSPGFIDYFIIGEHFRRYVESGFKADLYGNTIEKPIGIMWMYITVCMLPWTIYIYYNIARRFRTIKQDPWVTFLLCWLFWIPVFFTLSKNVMYTYMLTSTVPTALLVSHWMSFKTIKKWINFMVAIPILMIIFITIALVNFENIKPQINTDKFLVEKANEYQKKHPEVESTYYIWGGRSFSNQFYTQGTSISLSQEIILFKRRFDEGTPFFIQISGNKKQLEQFDSYISNFKPLYSNYKNRLYLVTPGNNQGTSTLDYDSPEIDSN